MKTSLRYKIVLWIVWGQIALLPIWLCMVYLIPHNQSWRWGLATWVFIVGFLLGMVGLPLSRDLDKPQFLKWWLRIDFSLTVILALPILYICSGYIPTTIAEDGEYIIYQEDGIVANRNTYLARKSGLLMKTIFVLFPYEGGRLNKDNYYFDNDRGVFYGSKTYNIRQNGSRTWVIPIDQEKYAENKEYVYHLIDSIYSSHGKWIDNDNATFIMPNCITRIEYSHGNIKLSDSISCEISYDDRDSVKIYFYHPLSKEIRLHKDSVTKMSPTQVQSFIEKLRGEMQ